MVSFAVFNVHQFGGETTSPFVYKTFNSIPLNGDLALLNNIRDAEWATLVPNRITNSEALVAETQHSSPICGSFWINLCTFRSAS